MNNKDYLGGKMDLITSGLIIGGAYLTLEGSKSLLNTLDKNIRIWNKITKLKGLNSYRVVKKENESCGITLTIKIPIAGTVGAIEGIKEELQNAYKGVVNIKDIPFSDKAEIEILRVVKIDMDYAPIKLKGTELLIGFDYKGVPIVADMLESPHFLLTGLSGQGKTGMLRVMIKNLLDNNNADIVLLNGFEEDYKGFNIKQIINQDDIKNFIEGELQGIEDGKEKNKPLYVIFEELGKIKDKKLIELTTKLLQYGRHNNIYLIGVIQTATKEELKFKSLFNSRCTFKQLEESSYRVVLGCGVEDKLQKREFYLYTNNLYRGKTYNYSFEN